MLLFQEGDFLVLPSSITLNGAKLLIDEALGISVPSNQTSHATSSTSHTSQPGGTSQPSGFLKLNTQKGMYSEDENLTHLT